MRRCVSRPLPVAQDGTLRDLYDEQTKAFVSDFIGESNIVYCEVVSVAAGRARVRLGSDRWSSTFRAGVLPAWPGLAWLAARPSRIDVHEADAPGTLPGMPGKVTHVGGHLETLVSTALGEALVVRPDVDAPFRAGQEIGLGFASRAPVLLTE